jgi:hypothetical protein
MPGMTSQKYPVKTEIRPSNSRIYLSIGSDMNPEAEVMTYLESVEKGVGG